MPAALVIQQSLDAGGATWQWTVAAVSLGIIAAAVVVAAGAVTWAALSISRQVDRLAPAVNELRDELLPAMRSLRAIGSRGETVAQRVHEEAEAVLVTSRRVRKKVDAATTRAEERLGDLDALYEVVYEEVADTALSLAGVLRTGRTVAGHARTLLGRRRRRAKRWPA
ncbi:MAG TPA: hypothetical protein VJ773_06925 [Gemmatimonadales bacterium]|nr:hypothetical protein [Gemmatimonadales bacterium]